MPIRVFIFRFNRIRKSQGSSLKFAMKAWEYLPDANKGIYISVRTNKEKSTIVIKIRDEGTGIPAEKLLNITDPFFTTKQNSGGVGLGLSISSKIVEEHGGTMNFESEIGAGTIATITLPVDRKNQTVKGSHI